MDKHGELSTVILATPAHNGSLTTAYVASVAKLVRRLTRRGIATDYISCSTSDLELSRNLLASKALSTDASHILFIDADMSFRPELIERMLAFNEPFVSAVYPKREIDLGKLLSNVTAEDIANPNGWGDVVSRNLNYVLHTDPAGEALVGRSGFAKVRGTGMGICLLRRDVLEKLVEVARTPRLTTSGAHFGFPGDFPVYGFFDRVRDANGVRLSEDYSFCARWTARCQGDIWACIDEPIGHVGTFEFKGVFAKSLHQTAA